MKREECKMKMTSTMLPVVFCLAILPLAGCAMCKLSRFEAPVSPTMEASAPSRIGASYFNDSVWRIPYFRQRLQFVKLERGGNYTLSETPSNFMMGKDLGLTFNGKWWVEKNDLVLGVENFRLIRFNITDAKPTRMEGVETGLGANDIVGIEIIRLKE